MRLEWNEVVMLQVMEVSLDTQLCTVMEGLTEDAVSARIHKGESNQPLHACPSKWDHASILLC